MSDFIKRNLVWIAILLCVAGVVLSLIGIPLKQPVFFFVGIILSIPTIGYLVYQVFVRRDAVELDLAPTTAKFSTSNITSIVADKDDIMLADKITNDDDLEPLYNGYANEQEIAKRLHEVTNAERERAVVELPEIILPEAEPNTAFDDTEAIETATNDELLRQRQVAAETPITFDPEIPADLMEEEPEPVMTNLEPEPIDETPTEMVAEPEPEPVYAFAPVPEPVQEAEPLPQSEGPTLTDPTFVPGKRVMPEPVATEQNLTPVDLTNSMVIRINPQNAELRKQKAQEKKAMLSQINLERYLQRYLIETAACFLMDRTMYKDKHGIAPYNKFAVNKNTGLPEYSMSATKGKLYKFCTYLVDAERFITHPVLYNDFITAVEQGISLARISETLHPLYRKNFKNDFILNLTNREDWDNVMILVYNNYILSNDNFKDVFTRVPFEIPAAYNEANIVDYLKDPDLQDRFVDRYAALEEMGVPTFWDALYICFINSIKPKLNIEQIENAMLREYKKIARALKRADVIRRRMLKKASEKTSNLKQKRRDPPRLFFLITTLQ